jgi:hypothetical protein
MNKIKRASGPALGSGKKKARLTIRCSGSLIYVLNQLQKDSWFLTGMSHSELIHKAVKDMARGQFPDATESLNRIIETL